jgi:excisionase family DNA binding protein
MRTIFEAASYIKQKDPETAITAYAIRRKVKTGEIPSWKTGNKFLIDIDLLESFFSNPVAAVDENSEYGKIRKIGIG